MKEFTIIVSKQSRIAEYLYDFRFVYRVFAEDSASVTFLYGGSHEPLSVITKLVSMFEPEQYTISKSTTGLSFIVWPKY